MLGGGLLTKALKASIGWIAGHGGDGGTENGGASLRFQRIPQVWLRTTPLFRPVKGFPI